MQDSKYTTSYKQEFGQPDNRKKQFINTAESLLSKYQQQEQYLNERLKSDYMYDYAFNIENNQKVFNKFLQLIESQQWVIWDINLSLDLPDDKVILL